MRYGVFADVHANFEALKTVLAFFRTQAIDMYLFAGDLVDYGPEPERCIDEIQRLDPLRIVAGNHDRAVCGLKELAWFNDYAQKSILWTQARLQQEQKIYLSELPRVLRYDECTVVHGSPRDHMDEYLLTLEQYDENVPYLDTTFTFIGHSHKPLIFSPDGLITPRENATITFTPKEKNIILNPGSAGQPRDDNNKAACAIFDSERREFSLIRLEYDIALTQKKMRRAKLPALLIERLSWGK